MIMKNSSFASSQKSSLKIDTLHGVDYQLRDKKTFLDSLENNSDILYSYYSAPEHQLNQIKNKYYFHFVSILFRFLISFLCLMEVLLHQTIDKDSSFHEFLKGAEKPYNTITFNTFLQAINKIYTIYLICSSGCGVIIGITGIVGLICLSIIYFQHKSFYYFFYESICVRIALVIAILHLALVLSRFHLFYLILQNHFTNFFIIKLLVIALNIIILVCTSILWSGCCFKLYTNLSLLRFLLAALTLFFTFSFIIILRFHFLLYKAQLTFPIESQLDILSNCVNIRGILSSSIGIITSVYSIVASFRRSVSFLFWDLLLLIFLTFIFLASFFSMNWSLDLLKLLSFQILVKKNFKTRVMHFLKINLNYLLLFEMITIISIIIQVISLLCFFFVPKYKPAEWNIPHRLVLCHKRFLHQRNMRCDKALRHCKN